MLGTLTASLVPLALATGSAATFNPCGVGLLPSYVGALVAGPGRAGRAAAVREGAGVGLCMTAGLLVLYIPVAAAFGTVAGFLGRHVAWLGVGVGGLVALWGLAILVRPQRFLLSLALPHPGGGRARSGATAAAAYGFAYGLASIGCTFPLFIALLAQAAAAADPLDGALVVLAYGVGMGVTVTLLAVLARLFRAGLSAVLQRAAPLAGRLAGLVTLLSGIYVLVYWLRPAL